VRRSARRCSGAGPDSEDPEPAEGRPPAQIVRFLAVAGLKLAQIRWCTLCHRFAYAVDKFEIAQLIELGWWLSDDGAGGLCADCRAKKRRR
jgi:hypothetical protein